MLSICDVCVMLYVLFVFVWCLFLSKGSEKEKVEEKENRKLRRSWSFLCCFTQSSPPTLRPCVHVFSEYTQV